MYNYDFSNEKVIYENRETYVSTNDKELVCSMLITDKSILLFDNIMKNNVLILRGVQIQPEYELILKKDLKGLSYRIDNENTIINLGDVILFNINLENIIK